MAPPHANPRRGCATHSAAKANFDPEDDIALAESYTGGEARRACNRNELNSHVPVSPLLPHHGRGNDWVSIFHLLATHEGHCVHATEIVRQRYLEMDEMKQLLLPTVLQMLRDSSDEDVVDSWMVTLLELLPLLDKATLVRSYTRSQCARLSSVREIVPPEPLVPTPVQEHDVASLALAKGEVDQQVTSRALCCRILGGLAPHVDTALIQRRFLNKAMASCQDTDYEVRVPSPVHIVRRARVNALLLIGIWGSCMDRSASVCATSWTQ